jgi:hypothetical protein
VKIEDHKSIGSDSQKDARPVSGRKPTQESRATEFRRRLTAWKQTPVSLRPSLRALARELGTSHQLLTFYLKRLEKWQGKEYWRQAREIRARAVAENRPMTPWEEQQVRAYDRVGARYTVESALLNKIERIKQDAKRGPLNRHQIQTLRIFVRQGWPGAKELLQECSQKGSRDKTPKDYREDFERVWAKYTSSLHPPSESEKPRLARRYERWRASLEEQGKCRTPK